MWHWDRFFQLCTLVIIVGWVCGILHLTQSANIILGMLASFIFSVIRGPFYEEREEE